MAPPVRCFRASTQTADLAHPHAPPRMVLILPGQPYPVVPRPMRNKQTGTQRGKTSHSLHSLARPSIPRGPSLILRRARLLHREKDEANASRQLRLTQGAVEGTALHVRRAPSSPLLASRKCTPRAQNAARASPPRLARETHRRQSPAKLAAASWQRRRSSSRTTGVSRRTRTVSPATQEGKDDGDEAQARTRRFGEEETSAARPDDDACRRRVPEPPRFHSAHSAPAPTTQSPHYIRAFPVLRAPHHPKPQNKRRKKGKTKTKKREKETIHTSSARSPTCSAGGSWRAGGASRRGSVEEGD
ncbi:hypothetical protein C8R47DRAFT_1209361 [Mycena vitilis]|nr:hypothetical protein C8R47DRAFT_1209361 [Mycena vitilis]